MSVFFEISHTTHYRYHQPVTLGEHRVMFRPRGSHDMRVLATDLKITPEPQDVRLIMDVYSNSIALVQPKSPSDELKIECFFAIEHVGTRALDLPLNLDAAQYPFKYSDEDLRALPHYLAPYYDDPTGELGDWARSFIRTDGPTGSRDLLVEMTRSIRDSMTYIARFSEGVQTPYETLRLRSGTCRDFATLMLEGARQLGYAGRFVTGYLYTPWLDDGNPEHVGAGSTHAWVQIYLPGAGWIPFDPTNNLVGGTDLIRVGVARHASLASPVSGSWNGYPGDYAGMFVDVQVRRK